MRCYLSPGRWTEGRVVLGREEAHHLVDVLRVRPGQGIELFDGEGRMAEATVESVARREVTVLIGPVETRPPPAPAFHLVQALPKAQKMDMIVQKATELGVRWIHPVRTRHAVARPDDRRGERQSERWQSVALAATRQCGAVHVPRVAAVTGLAQWLQAADRPRTVLVGDLRADAEPIRRVLEPLREDPPDAVAVVIGPEGDLAPEELAALAGAGARFVNLGESTLRTETAALYALALLRYTFRP